jgi:erythrocyte band 7 integral membrane protein
LAVIPFDWVGYDESDSWCGDFMGSIIWVISMLLISCTFFFSLCMTAKQVQEYERAVIFRLGRAKKGGAVGPGLFFIIPCMDTIQVVDLRTVSFDVPPQEILTKDSVNVAVDAVVYYKIQSHMYTMWQMQVNQTLGLHNTDKHTWQLHEIPAEREGIASNILASLNEATDPWGIKVERVEVKDIRLPQQLQRAMTAETEVIEKLGKVIEAEGEQKSLKALTEASDIITSHHISKH